MSTEETVSLPFIPYEVWSIILRKLDHHSLLKAIRVNPFWAFIIRGDPVLRKTVEAALRAYLREKEQQVDEYLFRSNPLMHIWPIRYDYILCTQAPFAAFRRMLVYLNLHLAVKQSNLYSVLRRESTLEFSPEDTDGYYKCMKARLDAIDGYAAKGKAIIDLCMKGSLKRINISLQQQKKKRRRASL